MRWATPLMNRITDWARATGDTAWAYLTKTPAERRRESADRAFHFAEYFEKQGDTTNAARLWAAIEKYETDFPGEWSRPRRRSES